MIKYPGLYTPYFSREPKTPLSCSKASLPWEVLVALEVQFLKKRYRRHSLGFRLWG